MNGRISRTLHPLTALKTLDHSGKDAATALAKSL